MNNGQNGPSPIKSVIQPITIDTMLNNNGLFFLKKVSCVNKASRFIYSERTMRKRIFLRYLSMFTVNIKFDCL